MADGLESPIDKRVAVLAGIAPRGGTSPEEHAAIQLAIDALYFLYGSGQWDLFQEYLAGANRSPPRRAERIFSSMQDAEGWLAQQSPGAVLGTLVKIGNVAYCIMRDPSKLMFRRSVELDELG